MFITIIYAILDPDSGEAKFARAGHEPPLLARAGSDGPAVPVKSKGMALGMVSEELFDSVIENASFKMGPGDVLALYTDGLTEASDPGGAEFSAKNWRKQSRHCAKEMRMI